MQDRIASKQTHQQEAASVSNVPESMLLAKVGTLEAHLANSKDEISDVQRLRYSVFVEEMGAAAAISRHSDQYDGDVYDQICDHLVVSDHSSNGRRKVVGTYRFILPEMLGGPGTEHFYSRSEFRIDELIHRHKDLRFLELGRSCVLPEYRTKRTIELLWAATWAYVRRNNVDVMLGCASFQGTNITEFDLPFSFLHHHVRADANWRVSANPGIGHSLNRMPANAINMKKALHALPPLIKGYIRLGAMVGDHAVIDQAFGTTDVLIILPVDHISPRYLNYYGENASRHSVA